MNALVLHSPRGLSRPRTQITRRAPANSIVATPFLTAVARTFGAFRSLAARAQDIVAAQERKSRWISSRQIESPEPPSQLDIPEPQSESMTFKVRRSGLLDIWD